jgi:DNA modification methylase
MPENAKPGVIGADQVPIADLRPYERNPRRGHVETIKGSLEAHGQYRPIVVNKRDNVVLAGNHTLLAAEQLGWEEIAVTFVDVDDEQARRILLVDNRTNDLAGYDTDVLVGLLEELDGLDGTGYEQDDLEALLDELERDRQAPREDEPPPLPAQPKTSPGDLYLLGRHRLLCGDAREPSAYERLLGDDHVNLLWTDPPYGVDYEGRTPAALRIAGDGADGLSELLRSAFAAADGALKGGARIYICHPSGELALPFIEAFLAQGWRPHQELVWVKDSLVLGRSDYHFRHEAILYGHKPGRGRIGRGGTGWYGDDSQTSVLEVDRPKASRQHPTMKPVELIEIALRNSTTRSHLVLDPFAGSGSMLVAGERLGRATRLIELDPRYCDVILARFEALTGTEARRDAP